MLIWLALSILASAVLYRVPRGGPDPEAWVPIVGRPINFPGGTMWAGLSALMFWASTGMPWWGGVAIWLAMDLGERKGAGMEEILSDGVLVWRANLRGLLLLNPLRGFIYEAFRRINDRLPKFGVWIDGWTAYSEVVCGLVTALSYAGVALTIKGLSG